MYIGQGGSTTYQTRSETTQCAGNPRTLTRASNTTIAPYKPKVTLRSCNANPAMNETACTRKDIRINRCGSTPTARTHSTGNKGYFGDLFNLSLAGEVLRMVRFIRAAKGGPIEGTRTILPSAKSASAFVILGSGRGVFSVQIRVSSPVAVLQSKNLGFK